MSKKHLTIAYLKREESLIQSGSFSNLLYNLFASSHSYIQERSLDEQI